MALSRQGAEKIWQVPGNHSPAVTSLQGSERQFAFVEQPRKGVWYLAVQDGGVEGAPREFCERKGQVAMWQTWWMQTWTDGIIYRVDSM